MTNSQSAIGTGIAQANAPGAVANVAINQYLLNTDEVLEKIEARYGRRSETPLDPFATVPPLPPSFIPRPEITESVIAAILTRKDSLPISIEGMGGIGKTVAAIEICHDVRTRSVFSDGILWTSIGKQSGVTTETRFKELAENLNLEFKTYSPASYRSMLKDKSVLVVLDDVWTIEGIEPFRLGTGRSLLLYTTRKRDLSSSLDAKNHDVSLLDSMQARRFLAFYSGRELSTLPEPQATQILSECKGLVLAIAMIGAALKAKGLDESNSAWDRVLRGLNQARLEDVGKKAAGSQFSSIAASIAASVNELSPEDRKRYLGLAILLEDIPAPSLLIQQIWGGDSYEVEDAIDRLVDLSLASRAALGAILLHDLQLDFIRNQHSSPESLKLVQAALLRSLHLIRRHPEQFAAQMTGRLLSFKQQPGIGQFLEILEANSPRPCVWPLWPALEQPGSPTLRILDTEGAWANAVALSADGRRAVSASSDGKLLVWDLESNLPPRVLEDHTEPVLSVALSADGKRAISGSQDGSIRVWYLESNAPPRVLSGHTENVGAVSMSADGKRAISGSHDKTLRIWDLDATTPPRILEEQTGTVTAVALSANGKRAVSSAWDRTLRVWDLQGDDPPRILEGHTGKVVAVGISGDGKHAVSGSWDRTVRVWNLGVNAPPRVLEGHTKRIDKVAISADGHIAASASSEDQSLRVWDLKNNMPTRIVADRELLLKAVAFNADGTRGISASADTLRVWNFENIFASLPTKGHTKSAAAVAITTDLTHVVSSAWDDTLVAWDLDGNRTTRLIERPTGAFGTMTVLSADGKRGACASEGRTVCVWDLDQLSKLRVLDGNMDSFALSADGRRAISGFGDGTIRIWEIDADTPPRIFKGHTGPVEAVSLSTDGRRAVSGSVDMTVSVWNLEDDTPPLVFEGHTAAVTQVALTTDGKRALSGSPDHWRSSADTLRIWDIEGDAPSVAFEGRANWAKKIAFGGNSKHAVSALGYTLLVWDLSSGESITAFVSDFVLECCAWRGNYIAAGDAQGQVYLFHWLD
jgi:WD40 repeat protein